MNETIRKRAGSIFIFIGVLMLLVTVVFQGKNGSFLDLTVNVIFLGTMLALVWMAFSRGFSAMRISLIDLKMIEDWMKENEDREASAIWYELKEGSVNLASEEVKKCWDSYFSCSMGMNQKPFGDPETFLAAHQSDFCDLIPGMLTALGILGTFLGLIISMVVFGDGVSADSLGELVKGMNVAFYTSIYGVALSIVFNLINNTFQYDLSETHKRVTDLLNDRFVAKAEMDPIVKLVQHETLIEEKLDELQEVISENIGMTIGKSLGKETRRSFDVINTTLNQVVGDFRKEQETGLKKVAEQLSGEVASALESHINRLGASVDRLSKSQDEMTRSMNTLLKQIQVTAKETATVNSNAYHMIKGLDQYAANVNALVDGVNNTFGIVTGYSREISNAASRQGAATRSIDESIARLEQVQRKEIAALGEMQRVLKADSDSYRANIRNMENLIGSVESSYKRQEDTQMELGRSVLELRDKLAERNAAMESLDQNIATSFHRVNESSADIVTAVNNLEREHALVLQDVSSYIEELKKSNSNPYAPGGANDNLYAVLLGQQQLIQQIVNNMEARENRRISVRIRGMLKKIKGLRG